MKRFSLYSTFGRAKCTGISCSLWF